MRENNNVYDVSAKLDSIFGAPGTESRRKAEDKAWQEYNAQILLEARKNAGLTQEALANRLGVNKGYISRIERGLTTPTISTFYRIVAAMGLEVKLCHIEY